jgi:hypothetical protein
MTTSASIEIPFAAEWTQLRRERREIEERLAKLDGERGRVSDTVLDRVRKDYERLLADLDARTRELGERAGQEARSIEDAKARQVVALAEARSAVEELDLRARLGERLDAPAARRLAELRGEVGRIEEDLRALDELLAGVQAIAAGRSAPFARPAPPPTQLSSSFELEPAPPSEAPTTPPSAIADFRPAPAPFRPTDTRTQAVVPPRLVPAESPDGADCFLLRPRTIVGRGADTDLRLPVGTVSRRHAELELTAEGWVVRDLHSENGTWVNGERVWEQKLVPGDQVQFGTVCLIFLDS